MQPAGTGTISVPGKTTWKKFRLTTAKETTSRYRWAPCRTVWRGYTAESANWLSEDWKYYEERTWVARGTTFKIWSEYHETLLLKGHVNSQKKQVFMLRQQQIFLEIRVSLKIQSLALECTTGHNRLTRTSHVTYSSALELLQFCPSFSQTVCEFQKSNAEFVQGAQQLFSISSSCILISVRRYKIMEGWYGNGRTGFSAAQIVC